MNSTKETRIPVTSDAIHIVFALAVLSNNLVCLNFSNQGVTQGSPSCSCISSYEINDRRKYGRLACEDSHSGIED